MVPRRFAWFFGLMAAGLAALMALGFAPNEQASRQARLPAAAAAVPPIVMGSNAECPFGVIPSEARGAVNEPVITVSTDRAALIGEEVALNAQADKAGLLLNSAELTALAEIMSCHRAIRYAYEAKIAAVSAVARDHYRFQIPPYRGAGQALRADFHSELRRTFGSDRADEILRKLGAQIEKEFANFGAGEQTLEFIARTDLAERDFTVTRTVLFPRRDGSTNGAVTRRETYIPSIEDASDEQWGPFLALLPQVPVRVIARN
jgi:hypothetical protein